MPIAPPTGARSARPDPPGRPGAPLLSRRASEHSPRPRTGGDDVPRRRRGGCAGYGERPHNAGDVDRRREAWCHKERRSKSARCPSHEARRRRAWHRLHQRHPVDVLQTLGVLPALGLGGACLPCGDHTPHRKDRVGHSPWLHPGGHDKRLSHGDLRFRGAVVPGGSLRGRCSVHRVRPHRRRHRAVDRRGYPRPIAVPGGTP